MTISDPCFTPVKTVLIARVLGYGGALPFLCGAIAASQQVAVLGLAPADLLLSYGAVMLSVLGGLHWGRVITSPNANGSSDSTWLIWSVCPPLLGWVALLLPVKVGAVLLSLCFLVALQIDQRLFREQTWPAWMRPLRLQTSQDLLQVFTGLLRVKAT